MGLWQNLSYSYEQNIETLKSIYPLSATSISNNSDIIAVIVIDEKGNFRSAKKIDKKSKATKKSPSSSLVTINVPVTEESMGRSNSIAPHPVFDQYVYLKGSGEKFEAYLTQLKKFSEFTLATEQIKSIYQYVKKRTVTSDLSDIKLNDKTFIIFEVELPGMPSRVWENIDFFEAWHQYYCEKKRTRATQKQWAESQLLDSKKHTPAEKKNIKELIELKDAISLDYISGAEQQPIAIFHPKKISNASANSKLISDNDKTNYTFRGKFSGSFEAVSIGYETSQKAHQFLRYLINDRGYYCGEQVILSLTIGSTENILPPPLEDTKSIYDMMQASQTRTDTDSQIILRAITGFDYTEALNKSLSGFGYAKTLNQHAKTAVIALDAATTGRLSITFYRELDRTEYLENIAKWHDSCKWHQKFWDNEANKYIPFIGAPAVDKIIETIHGLPRSGKDESYIKIKKSARERLLRCIFDGAFLPKDNVIAAIRRASSPLAIVRNGKFDRTGFDRILSTSCALIRKYYSQDKKEDYKLSIELDRTDRDYLYGRLLGAADKLEEYALKKKGNERVVTAAIRHMQTFAQHPFRTWQTIHSCLNPYIQTVKRGFEFQEIETIKNQFVSVDIFENDLPLNGSYLIAYYHERAYIDSLIKKTAEKKMLTKTNEQETNNDE